MKSIASGLTVGKIFFSNDSYSLGLKIGCGLDVYRIAFAEEFTINPESGVLEGGCCQIEYSYFPDNKLTNITWRRDNKKSKQTNLCY
ncbi:MAG: hypothetical protein H6558_03150 [Lewinellaceae bacterium]|nr:hypothetical protein [Lewinellaceae bacterium]